MDLKSTPKHRSSIPLPPCTTVRGYGIFHDISRGLETIWVVGEYLCMPHPLKLPYFGYLKVKAIQMSSGEGTWHVWRSRPYTIYGNACAFGRFWKVKVGHLTTLSPFLWLFHFDLELGEVTPNLCWILLQMYFYKINPKSKWENVLNPAEKHCLLWAQIRKIYIFVKVGYYPLLSLACTSNYAIALTMVVCCLLSFIIDNIIKCYLHLRIPMFNHMVHGNMEP